MNNIIEFDQFEAKLTEFNQRYGSVVYDLTVPEQEKQARSDRYAIGKIISALDDKHKELKAPLKEKVDLIDGERKRIKDQLLEVQGKIKGQIDAHEKAIQDHVEMLQAKVDAIRRHAEFTDPITLARHDLSVADLAERLKTVENMDIDDAYEDRKADATLAQVETIKKLKVALEQRQKLEAEQAELERLRKEKEERERADREEWIRQEAAEKAKQEAAAAVNRAKAQQEAAEARIREAEAKAKAEKERAAQRATEAAERAKIAQEEAVTKAKQAERDRIAKEQAQKAKDEAATQAKEEKAKANKKHREQIKKEVIESFNEHVFEDATSIFTLIDQGLIKHVTINY